MNFNKAIEILGLSSKHCTEKELKRAYYKNAIKWHPDKNGGSEEAEEKFKKIKEAYETLTSDNLDLINNESVKLIENKKYNKNEYNFF